jgi:hypothetical protein
MTCSGLLIVLVAASSAAAQQGSGTIAPADLARADSLFRGGDMPGASNLYSALVRRDSANGILWFKLGSSLDLQQKFADAAAAYARSAALGFQVLPAELRQARDYARINQSGRALEHLKRASVLGFPGALIDSEPALAPIRNRPEYAAIRAEAEAVRFPCRKVHDFDFWAGTFDVGPWDQPQIPASGVAVNTRSFEGCVFVEQFSSSRPGGGHGMSMTFYDVNRHTWRMVWNDDSNGSNDFEGSVKDGVMHFLGWVLDPSGRKVMASNTIERISADTVRQTYALSADTGKTWQTQQSGRWVRRGNGN